MAGPRRGPLPRIVRRTLTRQEQIIVAVRRHWAWLLEPVLTLVVATIFVLGFAMETGGTDPLLNVLWLGWLLVVGRTAWRWYLWWRHCFIVTTERFVLAHGSWVLTVSQLPLAFGQDVTLRQSVPGRLLGFGDFILETAPKDHLLKNLTWLPEPERLYRRIARLMQGADGKPAEETMIVPGYDDNRVVIVDDSSKTTPERVHRQAGDILVPTRGPGLLSLWRGVRSTMPVRPPVEVIPERVRRGLGTLVRTRTRTRTPSPTSSRNVTTTGKTPQQPSILRKL